MFFFTFSTCGRVMLELSFPISSWTNPTARIPSSSEAARAATRVKAATCGQRNQKHTRSRSRGSRRAEGSKQHEARVYRFSLCHSVKNQESYTIYDARACNTYSRSRTRHTCRGPLIMPFFVCRCSRLMTNNSSAVLFGHCHGKSLSRHIWWYFVSP